MKAEIKVGTVCNNNCKFCLNSEHNWDRYTQQIMAEIELYAKHPEIDTISITGGEPTIRKDFLQILYYLHLKRMYKVVHTNGRSLSHIWFVEKIKKFIPIYFLISLHAHNKELYKKLANADGYDQVMTGIKNIRQKGFSFGLNIVLNKYNIDHVEEIVKHHILLKSHLIQLTWMRPQGKACESGLMIPFSEAIKLKSAIEFLIQNKQPFAIIGLPDCILPEYKQYRGDPYSGQVGIAEKDFKSVHSLDVERKSLGKNCQNCKNNNSCKGIYSKFPSEFFDDLSPL